MFNILHPSNAPVSLLKSSIAAAIIGERHGRVVFEKVKIARVIRKNFPHFMVSDDSFSESEEAAIYPYIQPVESF